MNRRARAAAVVVLALMTTSCGVRGESTPTRLEGIALSPELVPAEAPAQEEGPSTAVFFVRGERLEAVERSTSPSLATAMRGLLQGPRATESEGGLRSAVPAGTSLRSASLVDGLATIDLSEDFSSVVGPEQVLAMAQLVYTATSIPNAVVVRIAIEGAPIDAARGDGSLSGGPVRREDYPDFVAG